MMRTPASPLSVVVSKSQGYWRRESRREPSLTQAFKREVMAEGYFNAFFKEEQKLGMGANGSVYLCQVNAALATLDWPTLKHP